MTTIIISFSEVMKMQTCERAWYYRYGLGLKSPDESDALATGNKGHKLLQDFYNLLSMGNSKEEAIKLVTARAGKVLRELQFADGTLLTAWTLVDNYIRATNFTSEAMFVETRFLLPASRLYPDDSRVENIQIGFTPDLVVKRKGNKIDVEDSKFIQRAWPQKKIDRCPQSKLYQIFLESMGYEISRSLLRFFNTKTGKISEKPYILTQKSREILLRDFYAGILRVLEYRQLDPVWYEDAPRTMNYLACQFCDFAEPCDLEAEGKSAKLTLETQFIKSDYDYTK